MPVGCDAMCPVLPAACHVSNLLTVATSIRRLQGVMCDLNKTLKEVYNAHSVAIVPGSGTFRMESAFAIAGSVIAGHRCLRLAPPLPLAQI